MKSRILLFGALLFSMARLSAQVNIEVVTDQDEFLPGEDIPVAARIINRSGQTLELGQAEGWLKFSIEARDGYVVLKTGEVPVKQEFKLESSERATVHANLAPYFHLPRAGHYLITASISIPEWGQVITSKPKGFDVIQGSKLWEEEFGVPKTGTSANPVPEMRRYSLQEANYLHGRLMLYAQVTENTGKIQKVLPIGPMLSFGQPEAKVDKVSDLHVLYQDGPRVFKYTVINPDGAVVARQTYDFTTRPRLLADADGDLSVVGGRRRLTHDDFPPLTAAGTNVSGPP